MFHVFVGLYLFRPTYRQYAAYGFLDLFFAYLTFLYSGVDGVYRFLRIAYQFEYVIACFGSHAGSLSGRVVFGYAAHLHAVGEYQAFVAPFVAYELFYGFGRERCRQAVPGYGRNVEVSGHYAGGAVFNQFVERHKLYAVEPVHVVRYERQVGVGVRFRISVAGEMLGGAYDASVFHSLYV